VIGTRVPTSDQRKWLWAILDDISDACALKDGVTQGTLHTGAAVGIDQLAAEEWLSHRGGPVVLHLPWAGFQNEWSDIMRKEYGEGMVGEDVALDQDDFNLAAWHHPKWDILGSSARSLHARNVRIVRPTEHVYAAPGDKPWGGGTAMGIKLALHFSKPITVKDQISDRKWESCGCRGAV
jgi:hypothetical protein